MTIATKIMGRKLSGLDPFTNFSWHTASWASDPLWTPPADGAVVASMRNAGSSGATLAEATNKPTYHASDSDLNSQASVAFDSSDVLSTAGFTLAQTFSVIIAYHLVAFPTGGVDQYLVMTRPLLDVTTQELGVSITDNKLHVHGGSGDIVSVGATNITQPHIMTGVYAGASSKMVHDGTTVTGTTQTHDATDLRLGTFLGITSNNYKIGFVGLISGDITAHAHWTELQADLKAFYNTP